MKLAPKEISETSPYYCAHKITESIRLYVEYSAYSIDDRPERIKVQKKHIHTWWYEFYEFNVIL